MVVATLFYAWSRSEYSFACFAYCQESAGLLFAFQVHLTVLVPDPPHFT